MEAETHGRHFPDDVFLYILLNEDIQILIKISLKFLPNGPINSSWPDVAYMRHEKQPSFP